MRKESIPFFPTEDLLQCSLLNSTSFLTDFFQQVAMYFFEEQLTMFTTVKN